MKIVEIAFNDILQSPKDCSDLLNKACHRHQAYNVVGCVSNEHTLFVSLEPGETTVKYRFAQLPSFAAEEIAGEINSRYAAGFSTIGSFKVEDTLWGLFAN